MAYGFVPIIHIAAAVLSVIELGLTAYVVSVYTGPFSGRSASTPNFMLFNSIWSLLVLTYVGITPLCYTRVFHRLVSLALEAVTLLFWFAGSIALAVWVGVPAYHASQAAVAFGFFLWALFVVLVAVDTLESMRSRRHHTNAQTKPAAYPGV